MIQKIIKFFKCLFCCFCKEPLEGEAIQINLSEDKVELIEKSRNLERLTNVLKKNKKNGN